MQRLVREASDETQQRDTLAQQETELDGLEAEFAAQRLQLTEQSDELHARREQIEHLKQVVEKLRHTLFGRKSEKIVVQLTETGRAGDRTGRG